MKMRSLVNAARAGLLILVLGFAVPGGPGTSPGEMPDVRPGSSSGYAARTRASVRPVLASHREKVVRKAHPARFHETSVHRFLNEHAVEVMEKRWTEGYEEVASHRAELSEGGEREDDNLRPVNHFYHPYHDIALGAIYAKAPDWAEGNNSNNTGDESTWKASILEYDYDEASLEEAYENLGHVAHLIGDMTQPDHIHVEQHLHDFPYWLDTGPQWEPWARANRKVLAEHMDPIPTPQLWSGRISELVRMTAREAFPQTVMLGTLYRDKEKAASGEIAELFDVSYEVIRYEEVGEVDNPSIIPLYGWVLRNIGNKRVVGYWDGFSNDAGETSIAILKASDTVSRDGAGFWEVCTEASNAGCYTPGTPGQFYIEDACNAVPRSGRGASLASAVSVGLTWDRVCVKQDALPLAYYYATRLWPIAISRIASLYAHYHDVVNPPPYVKEVSFVQPGSGALYGREWKNEARDINRPIPDPRLSGPPTVLPADLLSKFVRKLRTTAAQDTVFAVDELIKATVRFSEPVQDVTVSAVLNGASCSAATAALSVDQEKGEGDNWTASFNPSEVFSRDELSRASEIALCIQARDLHNHFAARQDPGGVLDSRPDSPAKADYEYPYDWREYEPGTDYVHTISLKRPQEPTLLLFDTSGSMAGSKIESARESALRAVDDLDSLSGSREAANVAVVVFGGGCGAGAARMLLPFTDDLAQVRQTIQSGIANPSGATPLHEARQEAESTLEQHLQQSTRHQTGRLMVLSDGMDTCQSTRPQGVYSRPSGSAPQNLAARGSTGAGRTRIRYLTVGFDLAPGSPAERDLQFLAANSGGRYYNASDGRQLVRAFERLLKTYQPRRPVGEGAYLPAAREAYWQGYTALSTHDYRQAVNAFDSYVTLLPGDPTGLYNLALAHEAADRYSGAVVNYRAYLTAYPAAPDRAEIEAKLPVLEQDRVDYFRYQVELLKSDLAYLKDYYQRLFRQDNAALAAEFEGFIREKGAFYADLPAVLELDDAWLTEASQSIGRAFETAARRIGSTTFDRDAVSLLSVPIRRLEGLIPKLEEARDAMQ